MIKLIVLTFLLTFVSEHNQDDSYCTVQIDMRSFDHSHGHGKDFKWNFNGQTISVDTNDYKVKIYAGFDTIYFEGQKGEKEQIICDLQKGEKYVIQFNMCCNDFNLYPSDKSSRNKKVEFVSNGKISKNLIGGFGNAGVFLKSGGQASLTDVFASVMVPNRHNIFIGEFIPGDDDDAMGMIFDPHTKKQIQPFKHPDNRILDFTYIFLHNDNIRITFDAKDNSTKVERVR